MNSERVAVRRATEWDENYKCAVSRMRTQKWDNPIEFEWTQNGLKLAEMGDLKQDWRRWKSVFMKELEAVGEANAYRKCVQVEENKVWGELKSVTKAEKQSDLGITEAEYDVTT